MDRIDLWPAGLPATPRHTLPADDPRGAEIPHLVPFLLPGAVQRPLIVVCPGGGYARRAAHEGDPVALWLNGLGYHAAVLHYRVMPWQYPAALLDARQGIRLVRSRAAAWGVDPAKVGILGFSAGGHVAVSAALLHARPGLDDHPGTLPGSARPDALIGCYPVVSAGPFRHSGSFQNLIGDPLTPERLAHVSLEDHVTADAPPTFLWHTGDDQAVPVENSLLLAMALRRHKVAVGLHVPPFGRHGLGLAKDDPVAGLWTEACRRWLVGIGWG
jgi:acetyl esterase/lipase